MFAIEHVCPYGESASESDECADCGVLATAAPVVALDLEHVLFFRRDRSGRHLLRRPAPEGTLHWPGSQGHANPIPGLQLSQRLPIAPILRCGGRSEQTDHG
jgi:hypothetical protein